MTTPADSPPPDPTDPSAGSRVTVTIGAMKVSYARKGDRRTSAPRATTAEIVVPSPLKVALLVATVSTIVSLKRELITLVRDRDLLRDPRLYVVAVLLVILTWHAAGRPRR